MNKDINYWLPESGTMSFMDFLKGNFTLMDIAILLNDEVRYQNALGPICNDLTHQATIYFQMKKDGISPIDCLYGLFHDAEETVLRDRCSPVKKALGKTQNEMKVDKLIKDSILRKLNINPSKFWPLVDNNLVHRYDTDVCELETRVFDSNWKDFDITKKKCKQDCASPFTVGYAKCTTPTGWVELLKKAAEACHAHTDLK